MAFNLVQHLQDQIEFSKKTFGPGRRTEMVIVHIKKELAEVSEDPTSLEEWVDVILLAFDGAWRSGASPEEICAALTGKLQKNKSRDWPDWRTLSSGVPVEHVRRTQDVADMIWKAAVADVEARERERA